MRILTGIEVDILEDGSLDQEPELLERLDVVVASVHSKLSMDAPAMTRRMLKAVENPHADVLGHCTGRLVTGGRGMRPESKFDAEKVFTACRDNGTAVEINSRPERRDPPTRLLNLALEIGCLFSIDTDSHAPASWSSSATARTRAGCEVPVDRIVNTGPPTADGRPRNVGPGLGIDTRLPCWRRPHLPVAGARLKRWRLHWIAHGALIVRHGSRSSS